MSLDVNKTSILVSITTEIINKMLFLGSEQRYPGSDPDKSDNDIKDSKTTIKELRRIRAELEELFTGAIL